MYHRSAEADLDSITRTREAWQEKRLNFNYAQDEFSPTSRSLTTECDPPDDVTLLGNWVAPVLAPIQSKV
jgi:hypothetical protein